MKVANIFLKKKANKDSFDVGREGKCENCKYFFRRKKTKQKTKTLSMLVERRNVRLPKAESGRKGSLKPVAVYF